MHLCYIEHFRRKFSYKQFLALFSFQISGKNYAERGILFNHNIVIILRHFQYLCRIAQLFLLINKIVHFFTLEVILLNYCVVYLVAILQTCVFFCK